MAPTSDPTRRFEARAGVYAKARPSYPPMVIDHLEQAIGLTPSHVIADLGSGTGISSRLFLSRGHKVHGVEPNAAMRREAERLLAGSATFHSVDGRAEATTLPDASVDLIVAAQAFHWFDLAAVRAEALRILRPGGVAVLLWNTRRKEGTLFNEGYEGLLCKHGTDFGRVRHENLTGSHLRTFFGGDFDKAVFANEQRLDLEGLRQRLLSSSYIPLAGEPGHEAMMRDLDALFAACSQDGHVVMPYDTEVHWARMKPLAGSTERRFLQKSTEDREK